MRVGFLVGLGLVILLVGWQGVAGVADRLADAGWAIFLVALFIPPDLLLRTASWQLLFLPGRAPRFAATTLAMWIGSSVNRLLPVATVGGELVKARLLALRGVRGLDAAASVVLDKTVQAISVLLWALVGIALLALLVSPEESLVGAALVGAALLALGIAGFVLVQRAGAFGRVAGPAARLSRGARWQSLIGSAAELDAVIRELYRRPGALVASTCLRLAQRMLMAGKVWLVAWLVGVPVGLEDAVMLNSLAVALRSVAFIVPGGLGVQESGYVMVGMLLGVPPDAMLAVSLAGRLGELLEGLPGLVAWHRVEGAELKSRRSVVSPCAPSL